MNSTFTTSKKIFVNNNEINLDLILEDELILCGTCMYYSKEKECIVGLSCAKVTIYQCGLKIASTITNLCGNYSLRIPKSLNYTICVCKDKKRKCNEINCSNSNFCLLNFIFNN